MEEAFWLEKWQKGETGFHRDQVNPWLEKYWGLLDGMPGDVLAPLCGKSLDMLWLAQHGRNVVGAELSPLAVETFFREAGLPVESASNAGLTSYSAPVGKVCITIWQGDFFALSPQQVESCRLVYDRAALIALPPPMRRQYVAHLQKLLPHAANILLVTLEYPQQAMDGPPFSVDECEVRELYAGWAQVTRIAAHDVLQENERFRQRGLTRLVEAVYHISKEK